MSTEPDDESIPFCGGMTYGMARERGILPRRNNSAKAITEIQMEAEIDAVTEHIIKACEIYAAQTLFEFMVWFKEQCWPIEPKEAKGAFDREQMTDALINQFLAERRE